VLGLDWTGRPGELMVGRSSRCDVVLADPTVSRRHARLRFRDGRWTLEDLDSMNGTSLNGRPVGRCELRPGDRLALGCLSLRVD
jgi:pSer/pThr/pTyr-binding forkhead associated (FHA) protein